MRPVRLFLLASLSGLIALTGCQPKKSDTEILMERANAYWEAARLFDLATMYDMELAAKEGRYLAADAHAVLTAPTRVRAYQLSNPQVNGNSGTVELTLTLIMAKYGGKGWDLTPSQDKWTKVDGVWYHGITKEQAEAAKAAAAKSAPPQGPTGSSPTPPASPEPPKETPQQQPPPAPATTGT